MTDTRDVTSYLRGFALLVVMTNHYVNRYVTDQLTYYAQGAIAIFFVLSGYGIFQSLAKSFSGRTPSLRDAFRFYYTRALRLYPLYWLFLLVYALTYGQVPSIWVWLGIPIELAPGIAYFVTLLIQCYLTAPLLFVAIGKLGTARYAALVVGGLLLVWATGMFLPSSIPYLSVYSYHHIALSHIFLFSLGLVMPNLLSLRVYMPARWALLPVSFVIFFVTVHYTRLQYFELGQYIAPLFILSTFAFHYLMISVRPRLVFGKVLIFMGVYSYPIYLFHLFLYDALEAIGVLEQGRWAGVLFVLLAFPVFLLACVLVERLTDKLRTHLERCAA